MLRSVSRSLLFHVVAKNIRNVPGTTSRRRERTQESDQVCGNSAKSPMHGQGKSQQRENHLIHGEVHILSDSHLVDESLIITIQINSFGVSLLRSVSRSLLFHDREKVLIGCTPKIQPIDQNVGAYRLLMIPSYTQYLLIHNTVSSRDTFLWFPAMTGHGLRGAVAGWYLLVLVVDEKRLSRNGVRVVVNHWW